MKVYISVDIEGVTGVTHWNETSLGHLDHSAAAKQMTQETIAACEGAFAAGADEVYIKDAHDSARNLILPLLPRNVKIMRGWDSSPMSMMAGLDESFDAAAYIGYHSAAHWNGNPLAHTMSTEFHSVFINGEYASEFILNSYLAAHFYVPSIFLSGDAMLCQCSLKLNPSMEVVAVKEGIGNATVNLHPDDACQAIHEGMKKGLQKRNSCLIQSPKTIELSVEFKEHWKARRASFYPGAQVVNDTTTKFMCNDIVQAKTALMFL